MYGIRPLRIAALIAAGATTLAGSNQPVGTPAGSSASSTPETAARNMRLVDAAGAYETLTETAFEAPFAELGTTLATARRKAADVRPLLSPEDAARLDSLGAEIDGALRGQDRTATAMGSPPSRVTGFS